MLTTNGEKGRLVNSFGIKPKISLLCFSVGWIGKKPRAAYISQQQMNMKGKPSGGVKMIKPNIWMGYIMCVWQKDDIILTNLCGTVQTAHQVNHQNKVSILMEYLSK